MQAYTNSAMERLGKVRLFAKAATTSLLLFVGVSMFNQASAQIVVVIETVGSYRATLSTENFHAGADDNVPLVVHVKPQASSYLALSLDPEEVEENGITSLYTSGTITAIQLYQGSSLLEEHEYPGASVLLDRATPGLYTLRVYEDGIATDFDLEVMAN